MEALHFVGTGFLKIDTIHQRNPSPPPPLPRQAFSFPCDFLLPHLVCDGRALELKPLVAKKPFQSPITHDKKKKQG